MMNNNFMQGQPNTVMMDQPTGVQGYPGMGESSQDRGGSAFDNQVTFLIKKG